MEKHYRTNNSYNNSKHLHTSIFSYRNWNIKRYSCPQLSIAYIYGTIFVNSVTEFKLCIIHLLCFKFRTFFLKHYIIVYMGCILNVFDFLVWEFIFPVKSVLNYLTMHNYHMFNVIYFCVPHHPIHKCFFAILSTGKASDITFMQKWNLYF